jgi:manganese/zinc/iron transport system substrate-binding protein
MKKIKTKILTVIMICILAFTAGCGEPSKDNGKLKVVTTIGMIADITENVGGEHINVIGLMGPGVDPHLYKASESDVRKLADAEIIFYNGLHLEAQMGEIIEKMEDKSVAVAEGIAESELLDFPAYPGFYDPHVWFDVQMWVTAVEAVQDTLVEKDPAHAEDYKANAAAYLKKLEELHAYVEAQAESVPKGQRVLVTAHDAFQYFGQKYGFEVKGLQGISTESEAGTKDVQELAQFIADNKIKAIFVESSVSERNIKAVQAAVQAKGWDVAIGGELFSDAMGDAGTVEGTYIGMVKHNIDTIAGALVGELAE